MSEAQNKFAEIGLRVELVADPNQGYVFDIVGRTDPKHEFDVEKKVWEVLKSKELNETVPEL